MNFPSIQHNTHQFNTEHINSTQDCLLFQNENENKCGILTISYLHQLIKQSQKFFSNDPRCKFFTPLSLDATNFENVYHKTCYSVLHSTKTDTQTAGQLAVCTQIYTKLHQSVDLLCRSVNKQQHSQQLQHKLLSVCLSVLTVQ